jgi:hypothetical protein
MAQPCCARVSRPHGFRREKQLRTIELCLVPYGGFLAQEYRVLEILLEDPLFCL